jgi:hypothetical protein
VSARRGVALWPGCTAVAPGAQTRPLADRSAVRRLGLALPARAPALAPLAAATREAVRRRPGSRGQFLA